MAKKPNRQAFDLGEDLKLAIPLCFLIVAPIPLLVTALTEVGVEAWSWDAFAAARIFAGHYLGGKAGKETATHSPPGPGRVQVEPKRYPENQSRHGSTNGFKSRTCHRAHIAF